MMSVLRSLVSATSTSTNGPDTRRSRRRTGPPLHVARESAVRRRPDLQFQTTQYLTPGRRRDAKRRRRACSAIAQQAARLVQEAHARRPASMPRPRGMPRAAPGCRAARAATPSAVSAAAGKSRQQPLDRHEPGAAAASDQLPAHRAARRPAVGSCRRASAAAPRRCAPHPSALPELVRQRPHVESARARDAQARRVHRPASTTSIAETVTSTGVSSGTRSARAPSRRPACRRPSWPRRPAASAERAAELVQTRARGPTDRIGRRSGTGSPPAVSDPSGVVGRRARTRTARRRYIPCRRTRGTAPAASPGRRRAARTPVARGSSVPVWPMRRSPRARRTRPTTSCEVGPDGLSTTSTPFMRSDVSVEALVRPRAPGASTMRGCTSSSRPATREAGGVLVAAAAELAARRTRTSTSYFERMLTRMSPSAPSLEEHDRLDLARGQRQVDQPLGVVVRAAARRPASRRPGTAPRAGRRRRAPSDRAARRSASACRSCCCRRPAAPCSPGSRRPRPSAGRCRRSAA